MTVGSETIFRIHYICFKVIKAHYQAVWDSILVILEDGPSDTIDYYCFSLYVWI